jgi:hypothetical protein
MRGKYWWNLFLHWHTESNWYVFSDKVARQYVLDGNFTAQHMKMKNPGDDIVLSDGLGYMVMEGPYEEHIANTFKSKEVSSSSGYVCPGCMLTALLGDRNPPAATTGLLMQQTPIERACEQLEWVRLPVQGMAVLCQTLWWIFIKGNSKCNYDFHLAVWWANYPRQKNVDYSICHALGYNSTGIEKALVIYDVACQWSIKFKDRVKICNALSLPPDMEIVPAVGNFTLVLTSLTVSQDIASTLCGALAMWTERY